MKTDQQGALIGFLIGMTNLNKTELMLGELRVEKGFLGIEKCVQVIDKKISEYDILNL